MSSKWVKTAALTIFYFGLAHAMAIFWACQLPAHPGSKVAELLAGKGGYPAQYRILAPWIIGFISRVFDLHMLPAELIFYWIAFFMAFFALRYWLHPFVPKAVSDLAPLWLIPLIIGNAALRYPADPLTFAFMPLLLGLLYRKDWTWLVVAFAVATISRETTILIVFGIGILALYSKEDRKQLALIGLLCIVIWVIEKLALILLFGRPAESVAAWKLQENLNFFAGKAVIKDELVILGHSTWHLGDKQILRHNEFLYTYPLSLLSFFSWANFAWILMFPRWRSKDVFLRRMAWLVPIYIAIIMCVGIVFEKRVYFELYPIIIALGLQTFFENK